MKNITKGKKKLSELSVDEFMDHGFDSDVSSIEEDEIEEEEQEEEQELDQEKDLIPIDLKKPNSQHKKQLERLKGRDPEFYKFLKENDEELLEFSGSDSEENDTIDNDDDEEHSDYKQDMGDEELEENNKEQLNGTKITPETIEDWKKELQGQSLKTLKVVMSAFHAAVDAMTPEDEKPSTEKTKIKSKFIAKEATTFNSLAAMCLKHTIGILDKHIKYQKEKKTKQPMLPSSSKDWGKIKGPIKQYLYDMLQLLRQLSDVSMLAIILRHCQILSPYYACFPKIVKMFLKRTIRMWSSGEEHVKVLAFLCIRKCVFLSPNLYEFTLKRLYLAFVQNSKFVTAQSKPVLVFMQNSLVELFGMNDAVAYQHAFVYIRQLAIHLRNAITIKKKDSYQTVYNWQFLSSLQLWSRVVGELYGDTLKPLVYPIVQIALGVCRLIPAARYYPIRFHCIDILNYISEKTGVYIPTATHILEIFESTEFMKKPKSSEKVPNLKVVLKVSKSQVSAKGYQDSVIECAFESLLEYYVIFSNSIAFPELVFPICYRMKRLIKNSKVPKVSKDLKTLLEKLQKHSEEVTKCRSNVTFSPKDLDQINDWEKQQREKKNAICQFHETLKRMKTLSNNNDRIGQAVDKDHTKESVEKTTKVSRKRKSKTSTGEESENKKTKTFKKERGERSGDDKKSSKKFKNDEDIVEAFQFSDDDV